MTLYERITSDMKDAMINHDKELLSTVRMLKSAIDLYRINNKLDSITDEIVIDIASKQVKNHKESIIEFNKGARTDLVEKLENEIKYLETYLPLQLTSDEIDIELDKIFDEVNPKGKEDMGLIMREVSLKLKGKADMKLVSEKVNKKLNS